MRASWQILSTTLIANLCGCESSPEPPEPGGLVRSVIDVCVGASEEMCGFAAADYVNTLFGSAMNEAGQVVFTFRPAGYFAQEGVLTMLGVFTTASGELVDSFYEPEPVLGIRYRYDATPCGPLVGEGSFLQLDVAGRWADGTLFAHETLEFILACNGDEECFALCPRPE